MAPVTEAMLFQHLLWLSSILLSFVRMNQGNAGPQWTTLIFVLEEVRKTRLHLTRGIQILLGVLAPTKAKSQTCDPCLRSTRRTRLLQDRSTSLSGENGSRPKKSSSKKLVGLLWQWLYSRLMSETVCTVALSHPYIAAPLALTSRCREGVT